MEKKIASHWWAVLVRGAVAILFGFLALFATGFTIDVLLILLAIYLFLSGLFSVIGSLMVTEINHWWVLLLEGLITIAAGIAIIVWPSLTLSVLILLIAFWAIISGIVEIIAGIFAAWAAPGKIVMIIAGIFSLILGIVIFAYPLISATILIWLVGIYALLAGIALVIFSVQLKSLEAKKNG